MNIKQLARRETRPLPKWVMSTTIAVLATVIVVQEVTSPHPNPFTLFGAGLIMLLAGFTWPPSPSESDTQ